MTLNITVNNYNQTIYESVTSSTTQFITLEAPAPQPAFMHAPPPTGAPCMEEAWARNLEERMRHMFAEQSDLISNKFDQLREDLSASSASGLPQGPFPPTYSVNFDPSTLPDFLPDATNVINDQHAPNFPQYAQAGDPHYLYMPPSIPNPLYEARPQPDPFFGATEANFYNMNTYPGACMHDYANTGLFYNTDDEVYAYVTQSNNGTESPTYNFSGLSEHSPYPINDESSYVPVTPVVNSVSFSPASTVSEAGHHDDDVTSSPDFLQTASTPCSPRDTSGETPKTSDPYVSELLHAVPLITSP